MLDNCVWVIGFFLLVVAIVCAVYPWRQSRYIAVCSACLLIVSVVLAYSMWGSFFKLQAYKRHAATAARARAILQKSHGLESLIIKIQQALQKNPKDAQGWFLLGRLYASQQQWLLAKQAFERAYQLTPHEEKIILNYAQSIFITTQAPLPNDVHLLLIELSQQFPTHADVWMLLAEDAYQHRSYHQAIVYWKRVLALLPANSKEAKALQQTVVKTMHLMEKT